MRGFEPHAHTRTAHILPTKMPLNASVADMKKYERVDEPDAILVDDPDLRPSRPRRSIPSSIGRAIGNAVRCCVCAPITCALRTILSVVFVTILVVVALGLALYFGLRQTDVGTTIVDQMRDTLISKVLTVIDDPGRRHRFSTLDALVLLPADTPFGDVLRQLSPPPPTWAGWLDIQPQSVKYNLTGPRNSEPSSLVLAAWDAIARTHLWLLPLPGDAGTAVPTTIVAETWATRPSAILVALVVPTRIVHAAGPSLATWDQIVGQVVALARVL